MANKGSFVKGQVRPGQGKRGPDKSTLLAKEAIALLVETNAPKMMEWLEQIAEEQGPLVAWKCMADVMEYHLPKLARTDISGNVGVSVNWPLPPGKLG